MSSEQKFILTGDLNFMGLGDAKHVFERIRSELCAADAVISNLECCFFADESKANNQSCTGHFYERSGQREGFYAHPAAAKALKNANITMVGNANNTNFGDEAIRSTISVLNDQQIAFSGVGTNWEEACKPALKTIHGIRVGFIQRTSVYWPSNHEASALHPGVATVKIHTAYSPKIDGYASNRPGTPPDIFTWVDSKYLKDLVTQIQNLKESTDILIASFHWGYKEEILDYMREIAHAAIDAGADIILGHGPHMPLPPEIYKSKPVFYGAGSFVFHNGHRGKVHGNWVGMMGRINIQNKRLKSFGFSLVRRNEKNQTFISELEDESVVLEPIFEAMRANGLSFDVDKCTVFFKMEKIEP